MASKKITITIEGGNIVEAKDVPEGFEIAVIDLDQKKVGQLWKYRVPDGYYSPKRGLEEKANKKRKV